VNNHNSIENTDINMTPPPSKELSQEDLLVIALRHRWIILSTTVLFLTVALFYLVKATPVYTSTARLYVEQSGPKIISEHEGFLTQSKNYLYTQSELMRSTPIVAGVVDNEQIRRFKTFENIDNPVGYLKKNLNITVGKKDDILAVSFDSPYPAEASQIVNTVVDSYVEYHSSRKRNIVSEVLKIIQKEKIKRDKELSDKFEQMLEFTHKNGVVSFGDSTGGHIVFQRLAKLSEFLTDAQLATVNARADYKAAQSMAAEPAKVKQFAAAQPNAGVRVVIDDDETQLRTELKRLGVEVKDVRNHCTESHPLVQIIRARMANIRAQLDGDVKDFAGVYLEILRQRWVMAKRRENELKASFDIQQKDAQDIGVKAVEYAVVQSELKRTEKLCDILDDRIKELSVTEDSGALNITLLEVARPADKPSKPEKAKIVAIALFLGFMFGCGLAVISDWLDYRLRSADEISAILGVPVLGVVPTMLESQPIMAGSRKVFLKLKSNVNERYQTICKIVFAGHYKNSMKHTRVVSSTSEKKEHVLDRQGIVARGQSVRLKPKSLVAETYRTIRTAVFFGVPKGEAKTILVTSPAPGDGKSTLVSNLAVTMAQAGQKTIVLDCDFRKPMQHNIFEADCSKGLSAVLAGTIGLNEAIQAGPVNGLDILTCGPEVPNPSEILNSDTFVEILRSLAEQYDRVVIDSPPVTPVTDSQILSAICDITLLVLRAEKSTRRLSVHARDSLLSVGGHLLGVIINDVSRRHEHYGYGRYGYGHYGYYGGYGYYGHYGYGHKEKEGKKEQEKVYA